MLALSRVRPLSLLEESNRLRFSYACVLAADSALGRRAFARMLRRNLSPQLPAGDGLWLAYTAWCFGSLNLSRLINRRVAKGAAGAVEGTVAAREAAFAEGIEDGSVQRELRVAIAGALRAGVDDGMIIVVPLSGRFLELFGLWRRQVERHVPGTLLVLALDDAANEAMAATGIRHVDLSQWFGFDQRGRIDDYSKRHLWVLRVFLLRELVQLGHTALSLDLDAVAVGDLAPLLESLPAADIVAQKDYSIPVDAARELGFVICCGFLLIRPSALTAEFLDRYARATVQELDDQTAINHMLVKHGVTERSADALCTKFNSAGLTWVLPDPSLISRDIAQGTVVRHFQQTMPLTVAELASRLGLG